MPGALIVKQMTGSPAHSSDFSHAAPGAIVPSNMLRQDGSTWKGALHVVAVDARNACTHVASADELTVTVPL
jgi:hypothetical protein